MGNAVANFQHLGMALAKADLVANLPRLPRRGQDHQQLECAGLAIVAAKYRRSARKQYCLYRQFAIDLDMVAAHRNPVRAIDLGIADDGVVAAVDDQVQTQGGVAGNGTVDFVDGSKELTHIVPLRMLKTGSNCSRARHCRPSVYLPDGQVAVL